MQIIDFEPAAGVAGSGSLLARFSAQVTPGIRLCNLKLVLTEYGAHRTYFPNVSGGGRSATVSGSVAKAMTTAALIELERHKTADGTHTENSNPAA
ncbi:hypothetical protein FZ934_07860 [Rhizobium grahamii]|uniref:Uncharacterized protein n=1 Tax=Rhizobium grahamii TaxID=1120045 RepID=A0A5Q0C524_9HYPH|nr:MULTISPECIES: hypothetical protein [Rhizobium]QFY60355.1 hypothetical protein FZ934_07860 [Rhizobium grahamii]QRM50519.1 hypothetical protein F3Y33_15030 [Rhizobium sp. BG6]